MAAWPTKNTLRYVMVGAVMGTLLGLVLRRQQIEDLRASTKQLGTLVGTRWKDSDARDKAMLDYTNSLRRLTWVMALMTVISTAFVVYSAVK